MNRGHILFTFSFDKLVNGFKENFQKIFDGEIGVDQAMKLQENENWIKRHWERLEKIPFREFSIGPRRLLPDWDGFNKVGNMIKEIFDKLKEKDTELNECSGWLESQGFKSQVNSFNNSP